MDAESIVRFLEALGAEKIKVDREWVRCRCLFSWNHESGDKNPSLGVKINDEGSSIAFCFVCGTIPLPRILHTLQLSEGHWNKEASDILTTDELPDDGIKRRVIVEYNDPYATMRSNKIPEPIPSVVLDKFPLLSELESTEGVKLLDWLISERYISAETARTRKVLALPKKNAVVFPIRSRSGFVYTLAVRSRIEKMYYHASAELVKTLWPEFRGKDWQFNSCGDTGLFYGEEFINPLRPVIVVESELDVLRLVTLGVNNVIACCGGIKEAQLPRLASIPVVYLAFDADKGGYKSRDRCASFLKEKTVVYVLDWSVVNRNDGGELENKEELVRVIRARKLV